MLSLLIQHIDIVVSKVDDRTQLQAVSTTTGVGEVLAQLPINIVIIHTLNALLYIAGFQGNFLTSVQSCEMMIAFPSQHWLRVKFTS
ncbi:TPA: hypothetical protein MYN91_004792 [Klebsiella pneumoniae]|nr:Uncharacterised protein [Klebsiella pneumoniae]HBR5205216.1 hypothetical protein [Klebsiella pneumoniae]HBR6624218.1 hypothetical protein [Klebsiella pneumoniae]HBR7965328.1 hypothetical protein [Klebsiella pneumoniae]HCB0714004.1 hypothetical protein [Klebsiella pneumoniae]